MSKSIKINDKVYQHLIEIQRPRETLSEEVSRLLELHTLLTKMEPILQGAGNFLEWQREPREKVKELPSVIGTDISGKPLIDRVRHE